MDFFEKAKTYKQNFFFGRSEIHDWDIFFNSQKYVRNFFSLKVSSKTEFVKSEKNMQNKMFIKKFGA